MNALLKFFSTSAGSFFKHLLLLFAVYTAQHGGIIGVNWVVALMAVLASALPALIKLIEGAGGFFDTPTGGYLKALITLALFYLGDFYAAHNTFDGLSITDLVNSVWIAFVPVLLNVINPQDPRYGLVSPKAKQ